MPQIRRPKKRYGSIRGRGRAGPYLPEWAKARNRRRERQERQRLGKSKPPPRRYRVAAGTPCHFRKLGEKHWRAGHMAHGVTFVGFLWRNQQCWGFEHAGVEYKLSVGRFQETWAD